MTKLQSS